MLITNQGAAAVFFALAAAAAALGALLVYLGIKKGGLKSEIGSIPTTPIKQLMQLQHAEVKGVCSTDYPIECPGFDAPCIYYSYTLKRRVRSKSSSGSTTHHWKTIDSGNNRAPFVLTDASGSVSVDPTDAKFDAPEVVDRYVEPGENLGAMADGPLKTILTAAASMGLGEREKLEVHAIQTGRELYVLGDVRKGADDALCVAKGDGEFFISTKSEEQLQRSLGRQTIAFHVSGAIAFAAAIALLVYGLR